MIAFKALLVLIAALQVFADEQHTVSSALTLRSKYRSMALRSIDNFESAIRDSVTNTASFAWKNVTTEAQAKLEAAESKVKQEAGQIVARGGGDKTNCVESFNKKDSRTVIDTIRSCVLTTDRILQERTDYLIQGMIVKSMELRHQVDGILKSITAGSSWEAEYQAGVQMIAKSIEEFMNEQQPKDEVDKIANDLVQEQIQCVDKHINEKYTPTVQARLNKLKACVGIKPL